MAPADIPFPKIEELKKKKKKEEEIDRDRVFDLYSNSERANFSPTATGYRANSHFSSGYSNPRRWGIFLLPRKFTFDKCHFYLYYGKKMKFPETDLFSNSVNNWLKQFDGILAVKVIESLYLSIALKCWRTFVNIVFIFFFKLSLKNKCNNYWTSSLFHLRFLNI